MGGGQIDREVEAWVTVLVGGWIDRRTGESGDRWVGRWMNSVLASFNANLTQVRIVWGKGTSTEKIPLLDWPLGKAMALFLMDY